MSLTKCIMRRRRGGASAREMELVTQSQVASDGRGPAALSRPHFQPDADFSGIIFGEMNAGLLKSFLYFDDGRELSFLNAFVSFNALQGRQA
jgi:hypothetical protein